MTITPTKGEHSKKWPAIELIFIPLTAPIGVFGLTIAIVRVVALLSGLQLGLAIYLGLFITVLIATAVTAGCTVLNLPYMLRFADLLAAYGVATLCLRLTGPITPGVIRYTDTVHLVQADTLTLLTVTVAWLLASLLTHVIKYVFPWKWLVARNPEFTQRLSEEEYTREVYQRKHADLAASKAWRCVYRAMSLLFVVIFLAAIFGSGAPVASDFPLAWSGLVTVFGLLIFLALVQLSARNRLLELEVHAKVPFTRTKALVAARSKNSTTGRKTATSGKHTKAVHNKRTLACLRKQKRMA